MRSLVCEFVVVALGVYISLSLTHSPRREHPYTLMIRTLKTRHAHCTHARTHARAHTQTHAQTNTHTHTHGHTRARKHTHSHARYAHALTKKTNMPIRQDKETNILHHAQPPTVQTKTNRTYNSNHIPTAAATTTSTTTAYATIHTQNCNEPRSVS